jgi:hypothetical protein
MRWDRRKETRTILAMASRLRLASFRSRLKARRESFRQSPGVLFGEILARILGTRAPAMALRCSAARMAEHRELPLKSVLLRLEDREGSLPATINKQHHSAA